MTTFPVSSTMHLTEVPIKRRLPFSPNRRLESDWYLNGVAEMGRDSTPSGSIERRKSIENNIEVLKHIYDRFNARDIDGVLVVLSDDIAWANGMDGGYVHGHEAVREYWTRQWSIVSPHVEPVQFNTAADGSIVVEVQQSVRDLEGKPLQDQTHGLRDTMVGHVFHFQDGKIVRFDIQDTSS